MSDEELVALLSTSRVTEDDILAILREHRVDRADRERVLELAIARVEQVASGAPPTGVRD